MREINISLEIDTDIFLKEVLGSSSHIQPQMERITPLIKGSTLWFRSYECIIDFYEFITALSSDWSVTSCFYDKENGLNRCFEYTSVCFLDQFLCSKNSSWIISVSNATRVEFLLKWSKLMLHLLSLIELYDGSQMETTLSRMGFTPLNVEGVLYTILSPSGQVGILEPNKCQEIRLHFTKLLAKVLDISPSLSKTLDEFFQHNIESPISEFIAKGGHVARQSGKTMVYIHVSPFNCNEIEPEYLFQINNMIDTLQRLDEAHIVSKLSRDIEKLYISLAKFGYIINETASPEASMIPGGIINLVSKFSSCRTILYSQILVLQRLQPPLYD
jgi:hypothetical protein